MESYTDIRDIVTNITNWDSPLCIAPRTFEQFFIWIREFFGFKIPYNFEEPCKGHSYPLNAMWEAYAEITPMAIWYANRAGGKTYDLSVLSFIESIFKKKCGINILGGSLDQAQKAISYLTEFWGYPNAPTHLLIGNQVSKRGYQLTNGSWVRALAASSKSVRGSHQPKLRIDECDEVDKNIYLAALGQPQTINGIPENIIISSTLHQPFGLMSEIVESKDDIGAKLFKWCVKEVQEPHGYWKIKDVELKKKQITKAMFDAEYLCLRPKVGDTIFDFESVDRSYRRGIKDKYNKKLYTEAGIDWGYAVTAMSIIQDTKEIFTNPITKTFEYIELTDRCREIADLCIEYDIKIIYCDSNPKDSNITLKKILKEKRCQTELITIAFNKWKDVGINVIRLLLEKDRLNITDKTAQEKCKKYHYKKPEQGIIAKEDDHICDSFIAWGSSRHHLLGI
jgi:hypothetical protein